MSSVNRVFSSCRCNDGYPYTMLKAAQPEEAQHHNSLHDDDRVMSNFFLIVSGCRDRDVDGP